MSHSVLLVDDDSGVLTVFRRYFERLGWDVESCTSGGDALAMHADVSPDVVLLDLRLPDMSGMPVLGQMKAMDPDVSVIMMTGHGDIGTAVEAMRMGAENFIPKPADLSHVGAVAEKAAEATRLKRHNRRLGQHLREREPLDTLGTSGMMREVAEQVVQVARANASVLLTGETGTGKGWLARAIHGMSERAQEPFVNVNCAGLQAGFLESELFGHEKGAFTDAKERKLGLFEVADGGTLFLDEIGDLSLELQPKILKVIEEKAFRRLGGTREVTVDVRVIAATNHDLEQDVREGRFREDLYYRLAVMPIHMPSLKEREDEDVADLVFRSLEDLRQQTGGGPANISEQALERLLAYHWPGNIRELRNVLERALILARDEDVLDVSFLPASVGGGGADDLDEQGEPVALDEVERRHIRRTLEQNRGNRSKTARDLGISRATLYDRLRRYGFEDVGREDADANAQS